MESFFVEEFTDKLYRIAFIDRHRIFEAQDPGKLASIFECSVVNPSREDNAQIFYALAPSINADKFLIDFENNYHTQKLNTWTIISKDPDNINLFLSVKILDRSDRLLLYEKQHSITPEGNFASSSNSLFSLIFFADKQKWKTGVLQRCIDCLVKPEYRKNPIVYSIIDEEYRKIMRYKLETEADISTFSDIALSTVVSYIRDIISFLGLKSSHDTTPFLLIPKKVYISLKLLLEFINNSSIYNKFEESTEFLSDILTMWSGACIKKEGETYQLQIDNNVKEGLSYMQPFLPIPETLSIIQKYF